MEMCEDPYFDDLERTSAEINDEEAHEPFFDWNTTAGLKLY